MRWIYAIGLIVAVFSLMTLTGCANSAQSRQASLPPLPGDLGQPYPIPDLTVGVDARLALAQNRAALSGCVARHGDTVGFYEDVRKEFGK